MSSNYEWQKQYTKQRVGDAHRMAEAHRMAKAGRSDTDTPRGPLAALVAAFSGLFSRRPSGEKHTLPAAPTGEAAAQSK